MSRNDFLVDGGDRAREALREQITPAVEAKFAEQLEHAGFLRRYLLRRRMEREIERRVAAEAADIAPPDALY